jgi:BlaI family transcriptional regulator, penicillinase repressor
MPIFWHMAPEKPIEPEFSRRERQIMDVVYRLGRASAAEVHAGIPDAPSATAVRTLLRILEEKGHLRHEKDGVRHMYVPTVARDAAQRSMMSHLLNTFFGGSSKAALATLLDVAERPLTKSEREELIKLIGSEREAGR